MKKALTIAGVDSGGGAGVLADIKTFSSFGVHGMAAITSVTSQNTLEVRGIHDIPPFMVAQQIECVVEDIGVDAAKTGMLSNSEIIKEVAKVLKKYDFPLVVDPVMVSKSGAMLLKEDAVETLKNEIIPRALIITPNKMEAEKIADMKINNMDDAVKAAIAIEKIGADYVLIKGGHMIGKRAVDILYHKGKIKKFSMPWQKGCTHGTGCSFSAAITANIAKGENIYQAIKIAKEFITMGIHFGIKVGRGHCPVNQIAYMQIPYEKWNVYSSLKKAVDEIFMDKDFMKFIPEVGANFAYSLPRDYVESENDVVAVDGRIRKGKEGIVMGDIKFGASRHLARALIKVMEYNENIRSVMNIKYSRKLIENAKKIFTVSFYDRKEEPEKIKRKEGSTMQWGIEYAIKKAGKIPDLIYHEGDIGKEPMILIFGKEPNEIVKKYKRLKKLMYQ